MSARCDVPFDALHAAGVAVTHDVLHVGVEMGDPWRTTCSPWRSNHMQAHLVPCALRGLSRGWGSPACRTTWISTGRKSSAEMLWALPAPSTTWACGPQRAERHLITVSPAQGVVARAVHCSLIGTGGRHLVSQRFEVGIDHFAAVPHTDLWCAPCQSLQPVLHAQPQGPYGPSCRVPSTHQLVPWRFVCVHPP